MIYKILEVHQQYEDGLLSLIAVLWQSNEAGWVRASYCTREPCSGYKFIKPKDELSDYFIQRVAGAGMNLPGILKEKYFPGIRLWER